MRLHQGVILCVWGGGGEATSGSGRLGVGESGGFEGREEECLGTRLGVTRCRGLPSSVVPN